MVTPIYISECLLWFKCILIPIEKEDEIEKSQDAHLSEKYLTRMELEQISNNLE